MPIITVKLCGYFRSWWVDVSGLPQYLLKQVETMKPDMKILGSYDFNKVSSTPGIAYGGSSRSDQFTVTWSLPNSVTRVQDTSVYSPPVESLNCLFNLFAKEGYRVMSSTSTNGETLGKTTYCVIWTFQT